MGYKVNKLAVNEVVSIFQRGYPKTVILGESTDQKVLKFLYEQGHKGIKLENGNNKG